MIEMIYLQGPGADAETAAALRRGRLRTEVLVNGQPATGAVVCFHPTGGEPLPLVPTGEVQDDGSFVLSTYKPGDGVPEGEYVVTVVWKEKQRALGKWRDVGPDKLKGTYADKSKSALRVHITPDNPDAIFHLNVP